MLEEKKNSDKEVSSKSQVECNSPDKEIKDQEAEKDVPVLSRSIINFK